MSRTLAAAVALAFAGTIAATPGIASAQVAAGQSVPGQIALAFAPAEAMRAKAFASFDKGFEQARAIDPKAQALEAEHPGVMAVARAAGRNAAISVFDARLPALHASVAGLFGDNLDGAEQRDLLDFLRSPAVAALRSGAVRVVDETKITADLAAAAKAGKPQVTGAQLSAAVDPSFVDRITPDQRGKLMAFGASPAGQALARLTPRLNDIMAHWMTDVIASQMAAVKPAAAAAVRAFVARSAPVGGSTTK